MFRHALAFYVLLVTSFFFGCGGGGSGSQDSNASFSLTATVSGLTSSGLVMSVNGSTVTVESGSSAVTLATGLIAGTAYTVSIFNQPTEQICSVASGTGIINSANIDNVVITCSDRSYTVGGNINGLNAPGLVLANDADTVTVNSGATTFTLPTSVANTSSYAVTVQTQPNGQSCAVSNGSGTINNANVISVTVMCTNQPFSLGGSISGLGNNTGLVLTNGLDTYNVPANATDFTLPTAVNYGSTYAVAVQSNPSGLTCSMSNATGTMGAANVTNVAVVCSNLAYHIGGSISGLTQSGLILANGTDALSVSASATTYTLPTSVAHGSNYAVTVQNQPTGQTCSVSNATGTVGSSAVTNVAVTCAINGYTVGGIISGLTASGLVLSNGTDTLTVSANATSFSMPTGVAYGATYDIAVETKPFLQICTISNGSGTVGGIVSNVQIACAPGVTLTTLESFSQYGEGCEAQGLLQASDGNLYGMTNAWGSSYGAGAVFKISSGGASTVLHSFTGLSDGANPYGNLIQASDGDLYGTTYNGGSNSEGTVFKITTSGTLTTLYSFTGGIDGAGPTGSLILASDGNFYGMTIYGSSGYGTVYKITPSGTLTTLHAFAGGSDGANPRGALLQASDGNFYGMTIYGGDNNLGTVFRITPAGALTTLYSFAGGSDGAYPLGGLIEASDGNLYGMTNGAADGGSNYGSVFKITVSGTLTPLHTFTGENDGAFPQGGLIQASDGNLYGTVYHGGSIPADVGAVFQITLNGTLTTLYSFTGGSNGNPYGINGANPHGNLLQANDGSLYGITLSGGNGGCGTLFYLR